MSDSPGGSLQVSSIYSTSDRIKSGVDDLTTDFREPLEIANSVKLLVVDDDIVDRKSIIRLLNKDELDFSMDEASSRDEALVKCNQNSYDCVLLDFHLGNSDALELLPAIRQCSADGRMPIVLVTGMGNEYLAAQAFKAGVHDYVVKSNLHADILTDAIEHAIQSVNLERENEKQQIELEFIGLHDHLTGLPNRKLFFDRFEQVMRNADRGNSIFYLCSMDLDRFKQINDTLGHEAGDRILVEVSRRLVETLRSSDTVARFGGDEFVAILDIAEVEGAVSVADKLSEAVSQPYTINDLEVSIGLSVGIAAYPECGTSAKDLLKKADSAMYEAKRGSRGIVVYSKNKQPDDQRAVAIATQISAIIESEALVLEYQPKIDLRTMTLFGVEALVRWRHPTLGLLPPVEFIPAVERTQQIKPMTYYITELAIKQCADWRDMGIDIPVAVNLSAKILDDEELPDRIEQMLDKWRLPVGYLTMEVTETGALANQKVATRILHELSTRGVKISVDDFGSGYTSFRYLRDFTIHELKIDRMFIDDLTKGTRDESIVRSMLELGKGFGVNVVAEGIENQGTFEMLKNMGCSHGQGYHFTGSLSANKLVVWASEWAIANR
jgi:diguanylate cyclase